MRDLCNNSYDDDYADDFMTDEERRAQARLEAELGPASSVVWDMDEGRWVTVFDDLDD